MQPTLTAALAFQVEHRGDALALRFEERDWSYRELQQCIVEKRQALRAAGLQRGDRLAILSDNSAEYIVLVLACAACGITLVPLNWRLAVAELVYQIEDAEVARLLVSPGLAALASGIAEACPTLPIAALERPVDGWDTLPATECSPVPAEHDAEGEADDCLLLVYTSGTTGRPKGALLSHRAVAWNALISQAFHRFAAGDRVLSNLPLFHVGGLNIQTLPALCAGASVLLQRRFEPDATLAALAGWQPQHYLAVPAVMRALQAQANWVDTPLQSLRMLVTGSSIIPLDLIDAWHRRGIPVTQVYGSTETCPVSVVLDPGSAIDQAGSCGKAALYCDTRIIDRNGDEVGVGVTGELCICGPNLFSGYWKNPDASDAVLHAGWYHTGDLAHRDAEGFIVIDDRQRDLIISGGENIYPAELERVLEQCPGLDDYTVVGRPDARWGEVPVIVAVANEAFDEAMVLARFDGQLAKFKRPHAVVLVDSLPRNAMGKVQKYRLQALWAD